MTTSGIIQRPGAGGAAAAALCLLALLLAPAPAPAAGPAPGELGALLAKVVAAYGGEAALAKVGGYRMEGTLTSSMRGTGPFVRLFQRPSRLRVELDYPGHPESRILDGARGWRSDGQGNLLPSEGPLLGSMVVQAARADLPWLLLERRQDLRLLAPPGDAAVRVIEIGLGPGLALTVAVDAASGRIVRTAGTINTPAMQTGFTTEYADFRSVDGVLFPFRESNGAGGQSTGDTVVTKVTLNPRLTDADFRP
jgi:hypothetical protein